MSSLYTGQDKEINVREELWYARYYATNEATLNNLIRKNPNVRIKMIGIQGCLDFGKRTRCEWTALQEDINQTVASGKIHTKPKWSSIDFEDLVEEVEWAAKDKNRVVIICSCPSQIGEDTTIMQQVKDTLAGNARVELTFSEADNGASSLFQSMSISGGGGGGGGVDPREGAGAARGR